MRYAHNEENCKTQNDIANNPQMGLLTVKQNGIANSKAQMGSQINIKGIPNSL